MGVPSPRRRLAALLVLALVVGPPATAAARKDRNDPFKHGAVGTRAYRLFVPSQPVRALVVALHGCWQTVEDFATGTRLNEAAERRALLVVYPIQTARDNPNRCWNWFLPAHQSRTRGELAEILAVVDDVRRQHRVSDDRVFALGFSAGAFMTVNLACVASDVFAAIGVAAGGPYRCGVGIAGGLQCMRGSQVDGVESATACRGALGGHQPPRAALWHGGLDAVVAARDLDALVVMFTQLAGATAGPTEQYDGATRSRWHDAQGREVLEAWLVAGMGHAWSGGSARGTHTFPPGPDATERTLDFFLR
jgi:poly(hydroxyalkanoate) depolymerase family esterase